ncbi:MAG: NAD-dependent epimerase/dehydratase family protein [Pseudomonadota bacterium]
MIVTGAAGFIGYHLARSYLDAGRTVVGIDNLTPYYDVALKQARLKELSGFEHFVQIDGDCARFDDIAGAVKRFAPDLVAHMAAQPGVRYSIDHPQDYLSANLAGFLNVLEACRHGGVRHLVYASSSSVYGNTTQLPTSEHVPADHPVSLYGATKRANELMAHTYSHLYRLPTTGLRFFTVYGPWGRPDMAPMIFTRKILAGEPIEVFNHGALQRDFTYVDDIVEGVVRISQQIPEPNPDWDPAAPDPASSNAPWRLYNIGNNSPIPLLEFISALETALGIDAVKIMKPMQPGDVYATAANIDDLAAAVGFRPNTPLKVGLDNFVAWYRGYYGNQPAPAEAAK